MGDIVALVLVGLILSAVIVHLKDKKYPEFALIIGFVFITVTMLRFIPSLADLVRVFNQVGRQAGLKGYYFDLVLRSLAVAYIASFGAQLSKDAGEGAVAIAIEFAAKVLILALGIPVLLAIIQTLADILS